MDCSGPKIRKLKNWRTMSWVKVTYSQGNKGQFNELRADGAIRDGEQLHFTSNKYNEPFVSQMLGNNFVYYWQKAVNGLDFVKYIWYRFDFSALKQHYKKFQSFFYAIWFCNVGPQLRWLCNSILCFTFWKLFGIYSTSVCECFETCAGHN